MNGGAPDVDRSAPPRLYHHYPREPFLELLDDRLPERAPRPLRRAFEHWQGHYARRERQHSELRERWQGRALRGQKERATVTNAHVRSELQETVARLCMWLLCHCDVRSRWVGKFAGPGTVTPYSLEEIAVALRRPGEEQIPLSTLCRAIGRVGAAGYIWRWQGRDRTVDDDGVESYRGKIATLRTTERFWRLSGGAFSIRERWLERVARRDRRRELGRPMENFAAFLAEFEREHPELSGWDAHRAARAAWPPPK